MNKRPAKKAPKIIASIRASERRRESESGTNALACPRCGHGRSYVVDSRKAGSDYVRRRRLCGKCETRFTSYEVHAEAFALLQSMLLIKPELERLIEKLNRAGV